MGQRMITNTPTELTAADDGYGFAEADQTLDYHARRVHLLLSRDGEHTSSVTGG